MDIREMTEEDRSTALQWLRKRFCDAALTPMETILPTTGITAADTGTGVLLAVAFVYFDQTAPIAVCGWIYTNPLNAARTSARAVTAIVRDLPGYARGKGARLLLSTFGNRGINRILERSGFLHGEFADNKIRIL